MTQAPSHAETIADDQVAVSPVEWQGLVWPGHNVVETWAVIGAGYLGLMILFLIGDAIPFLRTPILVIAVAAVLAVVIWGVRALLRRRRLKKVGLKDRPTMPAARIRLVERGGVPSLVARFEDTPFEPVIWRSVHSVRFAEVDQATGSPKLHKGRKPSIKTTLRRARAASVIDIAVGIVAFALIVLVARAIGGGFRGGMGQFMVWASFAVAAVASALVNPVYVRTAPGVLDVLTYPPLGFGKPRLDRYNLRTATVSIDADTGRIAIEDRTRKDWQTVFLRRHMLLGGKDAPFWIFSAARTGWPTPPLPEDELVG